MDDQSVSRETIQEGLSGLPSLRIADPSDAEEKLHALSERLATEAVRLGFLGPREAPRIWERHVLDSLRLAHLLESDATVIDVGSGAGLPGLALACIRTGQTTLLDSKGRRVAFVKEIANDLSLNVEVVWGRAEVAGTSAAHREQYDHAVARALAKPAVALELMLPFVKLGGTVVLAAGDPIKEAIEDAEYAAGEMGGSEVRVEKVPGAPNGSWCIIVGKTSSTPARYPRRAGTPAKRPLSRK